MLINVEVEWQGLGKVIGEVTFRFIGAYGYGQGIFSNSFRTVEHVSGDLPSACACALIFMPSEKISIYIDLSFPVNVLSIHFDTLLTSEFVSIPHAIDRPKIIE